MGVFDATSAGSVVKLYSEGGNGLSSFALTPNPSGSGGKGTTAIVVIGVLTFYSVALLPLMVVEGLLIDSSGTAVGLIPPATSFGLIIQSGTYWWSNAGPAWTPITPLKGRTTLVGGHSPVVAVAYMDANTRITLGRSAVNASTTLGELAALETERVNGAPGSFRISALQDATPGSLQAGDVSDVDYFVSN